MGFIEKGVVIFKKVNTLLGFILFNVGLLPVLAFAIFIAHIVVGLVIEG